MRKLISTLCVVLLSAVSLAAQGKRLWVLRAPGEMVEYDPSTFAARQTVKLPAEAAASPSNFAVNHLGQMLFAPSVSLPLTDGGLPAERASVVAVWPSQNHTLRSMSPVPRPQPDQTLPSPSRRRFLISLPMACVC